MFASIQITVRQFKERIQEKTGIEPDLQRLIYCGRVMGDDHPLSDYGLYFIMLYCSNCVLSKTLNQLKDILIFSL